MRNIDDYILEQEYKKIDEEWDMYFDMPDDEISILEAKYRFGRPIYDEDRGGFWNWLKRLGKKFWSWLTGKDLTDDDNDYSPRKGVRWIDTSSEHLDDLVNKKGFDELFPITTQFKRKYKDAVCLSGMNKDKLPAIITTLLIDKEHVHQLLKSFYSSKYQHYKSKISHADQICMILSIEINSKNEEDVSYIFNKMIVSMFSKNINQKFDIVFFHKDFLSSSMFKTMKKEFADLASMDMKFPMIMTKNFDWAEDEPEQTNTDNKEDTQDKQNKQDKENKDEKKNNTEEKIPDPEDAKVEIKKKDPVPKDETIPDSKIKFINTSNSKIVASAEWTTDVKRMNEILKININEKDYYNFLITKLDISNDYSVDEYENVLDDFILPSICNNLASAAKISSDKQIKVYIKLDDDEYADHIKKLRKLSLTEKIKIKESVNNIFIIIGQKTDDIIDTETELEDKEVKESLDVDNLFWMLDTWFANNEQEKTSFMSLVDNCIIKKTYNKNDLAKLCDNINFDIRPFINFMSKDAVKSTDDDNVDYYYELKKIIDALISNKATNNKYVRFS